MIPSNLNFIAVCGVYLVMFVTVVSAVGVVVLRNLFHSALALAFVLVGTAGIFISLHADFIAMAQILIYVGAVMTLIIFAIMLTHGLNDKAVASTNQQNIVALLGTLFFVLLIVRVVYHTPWVLQNPERFVSVRGLGRALLGPYVFPFEIISVILIAVLIGSIVLARKDKGES